MSPSAFLLALALWQTTPSGGAIAKFVPPVPTPASFISDQRAVLTPEQRRSLDARIGAIQQGGLGDIAVAILPDIGSYAPQQVAVEIYRTWKVGSVAAIGSPRRNLGVLLLIVPKELAPDNKGQCFILTGTGSEGAITDARAGAICRDSIIPHLRTRDYAGGIGAGVAAIEARMRGELALNSAGGSAPLVPGTLESPAGKRVSPLPIILAVVLAIGLAIVGIPLYLRNRRRICPRCGRHMRRLDEASDDAKLDRGQQLEETLKSVDYDVWVCECGETKIVPHRRWFSRYKECRECRRRTAEANYVIITPATTISTGYAERRYACRNCGANWTEAIVLPRIQQSSGSSSGGGGGGGGGGGHSFGGSGSTSGGGGGSSY